MKRAFGGLLSCILAVAAVAQDAAPPPAVARATGKATVSLPANLMVLSFERVFEGETFTELWPQVRDFRTDFVTGMNEKLEQVSLRITTDLDPISPARIVVSGGLVINFGPLLGQSDGEIALAKALDVAIALCKEHGCVPGALHYELADDAPLRQMAIEKATENAFLPGESVARALRTDVFTVDEVRVISVEMESGPPELSAESEMPSGRDVTCHAEVEVSYLLVDRS